MSDTALPTIEHFIGGQRSSGSSNRFGDVYNPGTGQVAARVPFATAAQVDAAVVNAHAATPGWAATPPAQRARILFRYQELLHKNMERLARVVSSEHGKTVEDAKGSITRGLEVVEFACGIPQLLKGEYNNTVAGGIDMYSVRQPLGVCVGITPFNFPAMVPMWMYPVAIACGNTFILKPSERDPSCPLILAELALEAGLPEGVLNVVHGDKEAVDALLTHPLVDAVSFVGSTPIAEYVYRTGTAAGKRVQALGGAKNHLVIMPDADLAQTTDALMGAAYGSAGERCMAVSVAVAVGDNTADALLASLTPRVAALKLGPHTDPDAQMGPLVTRAHLEKVTGYVDRGVEEGAELIVDGRKQSLQDHGNSPPPGDLPPEGFFLGGCLFDRVTPDMSIYTDEIFGPVLSVVRVDHYEEALQLVNAHEFGNGAAIFTRDGDTARDFTHRVKIGMVGVNVPIPVPTAYHSFGGWKRSLFGDHHMHGRRVYAFSPGSKPLPNAGHRALKRGRISPYPSCVMAEPDPIRESYSMRPAVL